MNLKITVLLEQWLHYLCFSLYSSVKNTLHINQQTIEHDDDLVFYDTELNEVNSVTGISPDSC